MRLEKAAVYIHDRKHQGTQPIGISTIVDRSTSEICKSIILSVLLSRYVVVLCGQRHFGETVSNLKACKKVHIRIFKHISI